MEVLESWSHGSGGSRGSREMLRHLNFYRFVLTFPRYFHLLIWASFLKNPDNTDYPGTQKVATSRDIGNDLNFP